MFKTEQWGVGYSRGVAGVGNATACFAGNSRYDADRFPGCVPDLQQLTISSLQFPFINLDYRAPT
jgi:hypothetical protein